MLVGTEKLELVIGFLADAGKAVSKAYEDGKLEVSDIQYLIPVLPEAVSAVGAISGAIPEVKDLTVIEGVHLVDVALQKLEGIVSEKSAAIVKQSLIVIMEAAKLVSIVKG